VSCLGQIVLCTLTAVAHTAFSAIFQTDLFHIVSKKKIIDISYKLDIPPTPSLHPTSTCSFYCNIRRHTLFPFPSCCQSHHIKAVERYILRNHWNTVCCELWLSSISLLRNHTFCPNKGILPSEPALGTFQH